MWLITLTVDRMLYLSRDNYQVSRKLAFVEDELEVAEDRVKSGDAKISELEEELKVSFCCSFV